MVERGEKVSEDALADIAYLARSSNRINIIKALAEGPHTSREVEEVTGISRSTLERILSELEERGWAERTTEGAYVATPAGGCAMTEFAPLIGAMQAIRTLGDAVAWLPNDELSIGLRHFSDATVILPEPDDPMAPDTRFVEIIRETRDYHCLACIPPSVAFENAMLDGLIDGRLTTEHIFTDGALAHLSDQPDRLRHWRNNIEAGATVYRYDGKIPCNLFIADRTVMIADQYPEVCEFIQIENEIVWSWAHEMIDMYRTKAEPLTGEMLTDEQPLSTKGTS